MVLVTEAYFFIIKIPLKIHMLSILMHPFKKFYAFQTDLCGHPFGYGTKSQMKEDPKVFE